MTNSCIDNDIIISSESITDSMSLETHKDIYIHDQGSVRINGDVIAKCLYVTGPSSVYITGRLNAGICLSSLAKVYIDKSSQIIHTMSMSENSSLVIKGNLVVKNVIELKIGNKSQLVIKGYASLVPYKDTLAVLAISIGPNACVSIDGDLNGFNRLPRGIMSIDSNTKLEIKGSMNIKAKVVIHDNSSLIITNDLCITGSLRLYKDSCVEIQGSAFVNLTSGYIELQNNSSIKVGKELRAISKCIKANDNVTITAGANIVFDCSLYSGASCMITGDSFIAKGELILGSNSSLRLRSRLIFNHNVTLMSGCSIVCETMDIGAYCILGMNSNLVATNFSSNSNKGDPLFIATGSNVLVRESMRIKSNIRIGPSVVLRSNNIFCGYLLIANNCKLEVANINSRCGILIDNDSCLIVTNNMDTYKLIISPESLVTINNDLIVTTLLLLESWSRLNVNNNLTCWELDIETNGRLTVLADTRVKHTYAKGCKVCLHGYLLVETMYLDSSSILLVGGSFMAGIVSIMYAPNSSILKEEIARMAKSIFSDELECYSRVIIKGDAMVSSELRTRNKEMSVIHDLYLPINPECDSMSIKGNVIVTTTKTIRDIILRLTN